jgi:hypothetical protein
MPGEVEDKALEALLDERVHLLICINLLENSDAKISPAAHDMAKHLRSVDDDIARLRYADSANWRTRSLAKARVAG